MASSGTKLSTGVPNPPAVKGSIPSFIQGVSQQPASVRIPSQLEECVNQFPSLQGQGSRRGPLEVTARLDSLTSAILSGQPTGLLLALTKSTDPYVHFYRRDSNESYAVVFTGAGIKVFSMEDGSERSVNVSVPGNNTYLSSSDDPVNDFYCYTYKDTTFVVNRRVVTRMAEEVTGTPTGLLLALTSPTGNVAPTRNPEALIRVKDAVSGYKYKVTTYIGNTSTTDNYTAVSGTSVSIVATQLESLMKAGVAALGGTTTVFENVIHVTHPTLSVRVEVSDNRSGTAISAFAKTATKLIDLPAYAPNGYQVSVVGTTDNANSQDANVADNIHYIFETDGGGSFASGIWKETVAPGTQIQIDANTMPHRLIREADGSFTFTTIPWDQRKVGDEITNPDPPFIGNTIHSCFLASNRFGLNSASFSCTSRVDEANYYNFFRTTMTTRLDGDPVTIPVPSSQVNKVYWTTPWNGELMAFGDSLDAAISWNNAFAQDRITVNTPTRFGISPTVPPMLSGSSLYFVKNRGEHSLLYQYQLDPVTSLKDASNLTAYVARYIPKNIIQMTGTEKDTIIMLTSENRSSLYLYNYTISGNRQQQTAFHRWDFDPSVRIYGIWVDGSRLRVVYKYGEATYLGFIDISIGAADGSLFSKVFLDNRIDDTRCLGATYDLPSDTTTITLPWVLSGVSDSTLQVELRSSFVNSAGATYPTGFVIPKESSSGNEIVLRGNWEGASFFVGYIYSSYVDLSQFYSLAQSPVDGSPQVDTWKRLTIKRICVTFSDTAALIVQAINRITGSTIESRELKVQLDSTATFYDRLALYTGSSIVSLRNPTADAKIRLLNNTSKPWSLVTLQWLGEAADASG